MKKRPLFFLSAALFILFAATALRAQSSDLIVGSNSTVPATNFSSGTSVYSNSYVGLEIAASNSVLVTGSDSLWRSGDELNVGENGSSNSLTVASGGKVETTYARIGNIASASSNIAIVTGAGSVWIKSSGLTVGSAGNSLQVIKGGLVHAGGLLFTWRATTQFR